MQANYRIRFSDEHIIQAVLRSRQQNRVRGLIFRFRFLLAILALALMALCVAAGEPWMSAIMGAALGALLVGWPIDKAVIRLRFRKSPFRNEDLAMTCSEEGVRAVGANQDSRVSWATYTRARVFEDGVLLFQGPHLYTWMPDAAVADASSPANLRQLARAHVKDYREV